MINIDNHFPIKEGTDIKKLEAAKKKLNLETVDMIINLDKTIRELIREIPQKNLDTLMFDKTGQRDRATRSMKLTFDMVEKLYEEI